MTREKITAIAERWGYLENAIQRVLVAQPWQMTEAAERLEVEKKTMRALVNEALQDAAKEATSA